MVLTAAFEFDPRSNKEATIRPTDNIEVPQVITDTVCSRDEPQFRLNLQIYACGREKDELSRINLKCVSQPSSLVFLVVDP